MTRKTTRRRSRPKRMSADRRTDQARIKVRGPEDFIAIVPYLLGFHPAESMVALFFDRGRVALTARLDLPGPPDAPPSFGAVADQLADLCDRVRATAVVLVCYSDVPDRRIELDRLAGDDRLQLLEFLLVGRDRWWSLLCSSPQCCPLEGTAYDLGAHPLSAEAVLAGLSAAPDRAAVAALVAGPPAADADLLEDLGADAVLRLNTLGRAERQRLMRAAVERGLRDPGALSDPDCAELAALCLDLEVRDVAWALMTRDDASSHLGVWRRVVSRTADVLAAGPLGLASVAGWLGGDGALLNCGIARLERLKPEYGLLQLLQDVSWRAVPPSSWDTLGPVMRAELDALAAP